jgi:hypothetical protein
VPGILCLFDKFSAIQQEKLKFHPFGENPPGNVSTTQSFLVFFAHAPLQLAM